MRIRKPVPGPPAATPPQTSAAERTQPLFPEQAIATVARVPVNGDLMGPFPPPSVGAGHGPAQHAAPQVHVAPEGGTVTVTWGEELFQPRQWHSYRVGPFTISATLLEGETVSQAVTRLSSELEQVAQVERVRKRQAYNRALAEIDQMAASARPG